MKPNIENIKSVTRSNAITRAVVTSQATRWQETRQTILQQLPDMPFIAPRVLAAMLRISESMLVAVIAYVNLGRYPGFDSLNDPWLYATVILVAAIGFPALLHVSGAYRLTNVLNPLPRLTGISAC